MQSDIADIFWIEVSLVGGQKMPVRIADIDWIDIDGSGSMIYFRPARTSRQKLKATETPEVLGDLIAAQRVEYTT